MCIVEKAEAYLQTIVQHRDGLTGGEIIQGLVAEIKRLEEEGEKDRCHGRDFIRLWKEGKERIAVLESEVTTLQTLVPHEGDGTCELCGSAPSGVHRFCSSCAESLF